VVAAFVLLAAGMLSATPPDRIRLIYSDSTGMLEIEEQNEVVEPSPSRQRCPMP